MSQLRRIAAFDFDGTLTRKDTLLPFLGWACGHARLTSALLRVAPTALRSRTGPLAGSVHPRDASKVALLRHLLAGRDADWYRDRGAAYATTLPGRIRPDVAERIEWHRDQGHELIIVSASLRTYLDRFATDHGFDHVIAVEMEVVDGRLTGAMVGPNVRGPEKAVRLRRWLGGDDAEIWAYGNSSGDRELLAMAHTPTLVKRPLLVTPPAPKPEMA